MTADFDARCCFHNKGIAFRPVGPVHGVEPHPAIADMDLQPVAVMLQLVRLPGPLGGCLVTIGWHG